MTASHTGQLEGRERDMASWLPSPLLCVLGSWTKLLLWSDDTLKAQKESNKQAIFLHYGYSCFLFVNPLIKVIGKSTTKFIGLGHSSRKHQRTNSCLTFQWGCVLFPKKAKITEKLCNYFHTLRTHSLCVIYCMHGRRRGGRSSSTNHIWFW